MTTRLCLDGWCCAGSTALYSKLKTAAVTLAAASSADRAAADHPWGHRILFRPETAPIWTRWDSKCVHTQLRVSVVSNILPTHEKLWAEIVGQCSRASRKRLKPAARGPDARHSAGISQPPARFTRTGACGRCTNGAAAAAAATAAASAKAGRKSSYRAAVGKSQPIAGTQAGRYHRGCVLLFSGLACWRSANCE